MFLSWFLYDEFSKFPVRPKTIKIYKQRSKPASSIPETTITKANITRPEASADQPGNITISSDSEQERTIEL